MIVASGWSHTSFHIKAARSHEHQICGVLCLWRRFGYTFIYLQMTEFVSVWCWSVWEALSHLLFGINHSVLVYSPRCHSVCSLVTSLITLWRSVTTQFSEHEVSTLPIRTKLSLKSSSRFGVEAVHLIHVNTTWSCVVMSGVYPVAGG